MREFAKSCVILLFLVTPILAQAPTVVSSSPEDGSIGVSIVSGLIRISFDQDMNRGSWTVWQADSGKLPPLLEFQNPWRDARTCEIPHGALEAETTYAIQLNKASRNRQGFVSAKGVALPDTVIRFRTGSAKVEPKADETARTTGVAIDLGPPHDDPKRLWTVLIYFDADNDIEQYAPEALDDIETSFPASGVEVIALMDRAEGYGNSHGDWTDARVFRLRRGGEAGKIDSELIAQLGEIDMGDPRTVASFVAAGLRSFPAPHSCLIMWDHGSGWSSNAVDHDPAGSGKEVDDLSLPELREGIAAGLKAVGRDKLDIINFHMCLMAQIEVATEMAPVARYMVASEAMIPCKIIPYGDLINGLVGKDDPRTAARDMVATYRAHYEKGEPLSSTSSAVDLGQVPELVAAIKALGTKLGDGVDRNWPTMARSLFFAVNYMGRLDYRGGPNSVSSLDFLDLVRRMRANMKDFPAEAELARVEKALAASVLDDYAGRNWRLSHGLAIYGPVRSDQVNRSYLDLLFAREGGWPELLDRVHQNQNREAAAPKIEDLRLVDATGKPTDEVIGLSASRIEFTVSGRNILWVLAQQVKRLKEPEGQAIMYRTFLVDPRYEKRKQESAADSVDLVMPIYVDGANPMAREVGGLSYVVTDGKKWCEATIDYSNPSDLGHARVPAIYSHPKEGKCLVDIFFDLNWSRAAYVIGYIPVEGDRVVPKMLRPNPEAEITPLFEVITPKGELSRAATGSLTWGEGLELLPMFQEPGSYGMLIAAESIEGVGVSKMLVYEQKGNAAFDKLAKEGSKFGARELLGDWKVQNGVLAENGGQVEFQDTDLTVRYFVEEGENPKFRYAFSKDGKAFSEGIVFVDTRGAPCLIYFENDEAQGWMRSELQIAFYLEGDGYQAFILKDVFAGNVYRLIRASRGPTPPPTVNLDGTWTAANGQISIVLAQGQYQTWMNGQMTDQGVYQIQGNVITARNYAGQSEQIGWSLQGNCLTLRYQNGVVLVLYRG